MKGAVNAAIELIKVSIPPGLVKLLGFVGRGVSAGAGQAFSAITSGQASATGFGGGIPYLPPRPAAVAGAGGPAVVLQGGISVGPTTVTLPPGTPEDHAKQMTQIFHENLEQAITHSLNMSARPGG